MNQVFFQGLAYMLHVTEYFVIKCDIHRFFLINNLSKYLHPETIIFFSSQLNYHRELVLMAYTSTFAKGILCQLWY